jgi:hypothetical protein
MINKFHIVMLVAKLQFTSDCQGWTGHSGNVMLVAGPLTGFSGFLEIFKNFRNALFYRIDIA